MTKQVSDLAVCHSKLGHWSSVGPKSYVFPSVTFGPWSSVGMYSLVLPGYKMRSHEHIPSGVIATPFGKVRRPGLQRHQEMFRLWDSVMCRRPGAYQMDVWEFMEECRMRDAKRLLDKLREHFGADFNGTTEVVLQ